MPSYEDFLETWGAEHGSDGCTHATEAYRVCCLEHDFHYVHGVTPRGVTITKERADQRFRDCLQAHSSFRWLSPLSWWRWLAVKQFGHGIWKRPMAAPSNRQHMSLYADRALQDARAARARISGTL